MKLVDLRKLSVRQQLRIRFAICNGLECVVTEHGIAEVPGLNTVPTFNLEHELESASEFVLEPAGTHAALQVRKVSRDEMVSMLASTRPGAAAADHEEE